MLETNSGIIAELDTYFLRKKPSDFLGAKDETGEIVSHRQNLYCDSLRPELFALRDYISS